MGGEPQERGGVALATASGGENAFVVGNGVAAGWGGNGAGPGSEVLRSRTWSLLAAAAWLLSSSSGLNPLRFCRTVKSEEEVDRYRELLAHAAHTVGRLAVTLGIFLLPDSVFAATAGGARDDVRDGVCDNCGDAQRHAAVDVPGDGVIVEEGGAPSPPPPARDDDHGTSPHNEAIQRIIPCAWLEERSCSGGAILPDPTSSSSMDGTSMMDLSLWGALVTVGGERCRSSREGCA